MADVTLSKARLVAAQECLEHSGGTATGQMCHFEADDWHALRALVGAVLRGDAVVLKEPK